MGVVARGSTQRREDAVEGIQWVHDTTSKSDRRAASGAAEAQARSCRAWKIRTHPIETADGCNLPFCRSAYAGLEQKKLPGASPARPSAPRQAGLSTAKDPALWGRQTMPGMPRGDLALGAPGPCDLRTMAYALGVPARYVAESASRRRRSKKRRPARAASTLSGPRARSPAAPPRSFLGCRPAVGRRAGRAASHPGGRRRPADAALQVLVDGWSPASPSPPGCRSSVGRNVAVSRAWSSRGRLR